MKHVLVYWSYDDPPHLANEDIGQRCPEYLARKQIDNMLSLGVPEDDVILATNFRFSYRGIDNVTLHKSMAPHNRSESCSKLLATSELMERGAIEGDSKFWLHDLDVLQNIEFEFPDMSTPLGLVPVRQQRPNDPTAMSTASMFFTADAKPLISALCSHILDDKVRLRGHGQDEYLVNRLINKALFQEGRDFTRLNHSYTYNFKPTILHTRNKADYSHLLPKIDFPIKAVDFNYMPIHHKRKWRKFLSDRLFEIIYGNKDK